MSGSGDDHGGSLNFPCLALTGALDIGMSTAKATTAACSPLAGPRGP